MSGFSSESSNINLFGSGSSAPPSLGLRQRQRHNNLTTTTKSASTTTNNNTENENAHPNNNPQPSRNNANNNIQAFGKWGSIITNVPAPPRLSLANSSGGALGYNKRNVASTTSTTTNQQQQKQQLELNNRDGELTQVLPVKESEPTTTKSSCSSAKNYLMMKTEADVMLYEDGSNMGIIDNISSGMKTTTLLLDTLCGKILGWFFMWDTSQS